MKILVLGTENGDYFAHNVAYTLRKMGHNVVSDPELGSASGKGRSRRGFETILASSSARFALRDDRRAIRLAADEKPDLAIVTTRTYEPETIEVIKKSGCLAICWYGDSPANLKRGHITSGEYDAVFVKDKRFANDLKDILGLEAHHLNEACNPDWHRPTNVRVGSHIVVAGTMYGYRNMILRRLIANGWDVRGFGPFPLPWAPKEVSCSHTGLFLDHVNKADEFGRGLACLNTFAPAERDSLNCRIFETCGCGGVLVSEYKEAIDEAFEPELEYLPFTTFGELMSQLSRLKSDSELARRLRVNASKKAHAEHTYEHRLTFILKTLDV